VAYLILLPSIFITLGNIDITEQSKDGQSKGKGSEKGGKKK
jgi:hypothetical protein